jgi:chromosome segregation ATPase
MAEILDEKFKEEMLRLMKTAVIKVGENAKEVALLRKDVDKNTRELKNLKKEIRANSGVLNDLYFRVTEMYNRLDDVEREIKSFAERFPDLEEEYKRIFSEVSKVVDSIVNDSPDAKIQVDELDV